MAKSKGVRIKHIKGEKIVPNPMQFLADSGLLFHLNRTCFHPLGFALTADKDPDTGRLVFCKIVDARNSPFYVFDKATFDAGSDKFAAYMARSKDVMTARKKKLGFVVQESGD